MIQLISVDPSQHRDLFESWVRSDHVACWWGDPVMRLAQFDRTPGSDHAIIAQDGRPAGYVRWEVVDLDALATLGLQDIPQGSVDVDIFVADPRRTGRGIGPAALSLVFEHLKSSSGVPLAGLCTSIENTIAHRAFEKAGCIRHAQFDDGTFGPCWVYVRRLSDEPAARPLPSNGFMVSKNMSDEPNSSFEHSRSGLPENATRNPSVSHQE